MTDIQTEPREKYHAVNSQWPADLPDLTGEEAIAAAKRLYRFAMKKPWPGKWELTSGNRYTWARGRIFKVNPKRTGWTETGWRDLVHMMSHYCHRQLFPKAKPHSGAHHFLEKEMVAYVIGQGWLKGTLRKPGKPAKADPRAVRHQRVLAGIERWEAKRKRAEKALAKLRRRATYYERVNGACH